MNKSPIGKRTQDQIDMRQCFGSRQPAIFNVNTPTVGECRDCNSTVKTDPRGYTLTHDTSDRQCWSDRIH